ncbi:hypothetical protein [Candidatus Pantoea floridensis]|uniref:Uncharacterized protein n=1 Tax=Candidatus Pantoea floridensis TaxID=1938870 RepID=A0A286BXC0_9GAMM|nr:hypothetical protein [Pantoea floridensis]PIF21291.1 hypothetical protein BX596_0683 [Enterobacteriaceae bacterium JKS000233]SOD38803.1 hypothetical protein SAMN06273570_3236 [Pantoea floridensis]
MADIQHSSLTGVDLHECKGAASATAGQFLIANGNGTATFQALSSVPASVTVNGITLAALIARIVALESKAG